MSAYLPPRLPTESARCRGFHLSPLVLSTTPQTRQRQPQESDCQGQRRVRVQSLLRRIAKPVEQWPWQRGPNSPAPSNPPTPRTRVPHPASSDPSTRAELG